MEMEKQKSLQKFTDLEQIDSVKKVKEYITENPDGRKPLYESLVKRLNESYKHGLALDYNITEMMAAIFEKEEAIDDVRNTTYEFNHGKITSFIHNYALDYRSFPTVSEIHLSTGLSRQTVYNHLKNGLNDKHNKLVKGVNEVMALKALQKLYLIGIEDNNPTALKHFIQLSKASNSSSTTNNYIQINNLKISKDQFDQLPNETILEIESILSKTLNK